MVGLRRSSKTLPKVKPAPKKKCHGQCLVFPVWSTTAFWNPGETITSEKYAQQIDEMRWKLQRLQSVSVNRTGLILLQDNAQPHVAQPTLQSWMNWATELCPIRSIHLTSCQLPLLQASLQLVAGKMHPHPSGGKKCFPRVCQIPKHRFLCYRNKQTCFSLAKMCWM